MVSRGTLLQKLLGLGFVGLLVCILVYGWLSFGFGRAGPSTVDTVVIIPKGSSVQKAAKLLAKANVIGTAERFILQAKLFGSKRSVLAGEYEIPRGSSASDVLALLQSGSVLLHKFLVSEGMSAVQVYERLQAEPLLTGTIDVPVEGSLLPETYTFERDEARGDIIKRMQKSMRETLDRLWAKRAPNLPLKTPEEAVILASIVEKETARKSELKEVAGVYINRLNRGMKLQADPTVIYPVTKGKPLGRRILRSELNAINGYNTYAMTGLPKGPITNPGIAALKAVLAPNHTNNLYFVADGKGGSAFSATLQEHESHVANWRSVHDGK